MQNLNRLFHSLLLLTTTPSLLLYPSAEIRADDYSQMQVYYEEEYIWDRLNRGELVTFDEMLEFLDQFENGDLDHLPDEECEKIIHLIILLSRNGIHPDDIEGRAALEADIEELLRDDDDDSYEYDLSFHDTKGQLEFAVLQSGQKMHPTLCKGWIKKKVHQGKHYFKKHKKGLLIGTAVVVAVVVVVTCVALSAPAVAGAAGAMAAPSSKQNKDSAHEAPSHEESIAPPSNPLAEVLEEQILAGKEEIIEKTYVETSLTKENTPTFKDDLRVFGSIVSHEIVETVGELGFILPVLKETNKHRSTIDEEKGPIECYEEGLVRVHEVVDDIFSTDITPHRYTPEAKSEKRAFEEATGTRMLEAKIPTPGNLVTGAVLEVSSALRNARIASEAGILTEETTYAMRTIAAHPEVQKDVAKGARFFSDPHDIELFKKTKTAEICFKAVKGREVAEEEVRALLHYHDIPTFSWPDGIPKN